MKPEGDILISGGSGSFGRAMVRRLLADLDPATESPRVIVYSRDELKQANMRAKFGDNKHLRFFIGDVRDLQRLRRAFDGVHTVIHAAALKRIETGAYNPCELVKTNVLGTMNVIDAAHDTTVTKAILLSSDKAYQPVSAYGCSKAMAEALFLAANNARGKYGPAYSVVRYGNIAGSNGSVIPTWRALTRSEQRWCPITDPECTRFWMWQHEAVDLVLKTLSTMKGGELVIPDLPAYRLGDLAEAMGVMFAVTGLPAHEKLAESMDDTRCSATARRMSVDELKEALRHV